MNDKNDKNFFYERIVDISYQKEKLLTENNSLVSENEKLKNKIIELEGKIKELESGIPIEKIVEFVDKMKENWLAENSKKEVIEDVEGRAQK